MSAMEEIRDYVLSRLSEDVRTLIGQVKGIYTTAL